MKKKKIAKLIGVTLLTGAVGAGVIVGASYLGDYFVFLDDTYLPREKIEYLTDELGLDDSITYKQDFNRLRHKNGEPINISFDENYPEECKTYSIEAIDNLFNLVHEINPLYTYSIVDDTHAADLEFRNSTIPIDNATGIANYFDHSVTIDLSSSFFYNEDGTIRPHSVEMVTIHELMHHFGFKDVYDKTDIHYYNTVMYSTSSTLSINEYGNLIVNYSPNTSDEDMPKLLASLKTHIIDYASTLDISTRFSQQLKTYQKVENLDPIENNAHLELTKKDYTYEITIKDDEFILDTIGQDGKTETQIGKILRLNNNMIILQNAHWKENHLSETYMMNKDITIAKSGDDYFLYNDYIISALTNLNAENTLSC